MSEFREQIKKLRLFHSVVSLTLTIVLLVSFYLLNKEQAVKISGGLNAVTELTLAVFAVLIVIAAHLIFRSRRNKLITESDIIKRLGALRNALILQYAMIEASILLCTVIFYMSGTRNFFLYGLMFVVYLLYLRPHDQKLRSDLNIEESEFNELK